MVSKEDFIQWRDQEVTQEFKKDALEAISEFGTEIIGREVPNLNRDQFLKGFIKGLNAAIEWVPELEPQPEKESQDD